MSNYDDPYRLWHQALQRSNRKNWSEKVKSFLGSSDGLDFEQWWQEVGEYFQELTREERFAVKLIESESELSDWWEDYGGDEDIELVSINLLNPTSVLEEEFGKLIRKLRKNKPGRPVYESFAPDFPLCRPPRIDLIKTMLRCYDAHKENEPKPKGPKLSLYELGVATGVQVGYVVDPVRDDARASEEKRIKMAVTFSRMVKRAEALIKNVEQGVFPQY